MSPLDSSDHSSLLQDVQLQPQATIQLPNLAQAFKIQEPTSSRESNSRPWLNTRGSQIEVANIAKYEAESLSTSTTKPCGELSNMFLQKRRARER